MNFKDYQQGAAATSGAGKWQPLTQPGTRLAIAALGLTGEAGELLAVAKEALFLFQLAPETTAKLGSEMGDVCWYVAEIATCLDLVGIEFPLHDSLKWPPSITGCAGDICVAAARVADQIKKHLGHGHELNQTQLVEELNLILGYVGRLGVAYGLTIDQISQGNLDKLDRRYGQRGGFSVENSRERVE
jgi:hypothetical protein